MIAPQPLSPSVGADTFFVGDVAWPGSVARFDTGDARTRYVGHYDDAQLPPAKFADGRLQRRRRAGHPAKVHDRSHVRLRAHRDVHGRVCAGRRRFAPHPSVRRIVFFLEGAGDCTFEGRTYVVEPLTCCWTGVGAKHAIYARGDASVKFLERKRRSRPRGKRSASIPNGPRCGGATPTERARSNACRCAATSAVECC